jgi:hypothetical protein
MTKTKKILAAIRPEARKHISEALADFDLTFVGSVDEAQKCLGEFSLILINVHFEDGRMFDLLRYAKAGPDTRTIPFLCIQTAREQLPASSLHGVQIALDMLGAEPLVQLSDWQAKLGDDAAFERLRRLVADHID